MEDRFSQAADYLAHLVASDPARVPDAGKLQMYGLYKQATVGDCSSQKPSIWDFSGRAKWDAWRKLAGTSQQAAMQAYVEQMGQIEPGWDSKAQRPGSSAAGGARRGGGGGGGGGAMGPVFSTMAASQVDDIAAAMGPATIHELAGQGNLAALNDLLTSAPDAAAAARDADGCSALHFAADRGQLAAAALLLEHGAPVDARDVDGQTPLHYAAACAHEQMCRFLLQAGADASAVDTDGLSVRDLAPSTWRLWEEAPSPAQ